MKIINILGNKTAGFILGFICVINLILSSIVMNMNPKIYPPFSNFNLNFFFNPVLPIHFWLYLLLVCFFLFGGNMFFSTLETIIGLFKGNSNSTSSRVVFRRKIAAVFSHLAIIIALFAHFYDGFEGESKRLQIGNLKKPNGETTKIPGLGSVKINSVKKLKYPDGTTRDTLVSVTFVLPDGKTVERVISYNSPAMFNYGMKEVVIQEGRVVPYALVLTDKFENEISLTVERPVKVAGGSIQFASIYETRRGISVAHFKWIPEGGKEEKLFMVVGQKTTSHNTISLGGELYKYKKSVEALMFWALFVYNPTIPFMIISIFFMLISLFFMVKPARRENV